MSWSCSISFLAVARNLKVEVSNNVQKHLSRCLQRLAATLDVREHAHTACALRNRARNWHRDSLRRESARERSYSDPGGSQQRIVAECHSEYGLRASLPSQSDVSFPVRASIAKLAERAVLELTQGETVMMICLGRHMPLREIAGQLGISYPNERGGPPASGNEK